MKNQSFSDRPFCYLVHRKHDRKSVNMDREQINELFKRFEEACYIHSGVECWSARELQTILGYARWENFKVVLDRARKACEGSGAGVLDHFRDVTKMITLPKGAERPVEDVALTRYACYLIAQNGDPSKPEIAFAQTYFAVQTRKQEIIEKRLLDVARVSAREKLTKSEKKLSGIIFERGVDERGFGIIRSKGDQALFGWLHYRRHEAKARRARQQTIGAFPTHAHDQSQGLRR